MDKIPEWIEACVALLAALVGYAEYRRHRRESRVKLAQDLVEKLDKDELLFFSVTTLDWGAGLIPVPPSWQAFTGASQIAFNLDLIKDALNPSLTPQTASDPIRLLYRRAFVHLFNHLERIAYLVKDGSLELGDLGNLEWVLTQLLNWEYAPSDIRKTIFRNPIQRWYSDGVLYDLPLKIERSHNPSNREEHKGG
jgi:hypothetical protein